MRLSNRKFYHLLTELEKKQILKRNNKLTTEMMKIFNECNDEIKKQRNKITNKQKEK